ncbi:MAG TPA: Slp family lipoprotein [Candidatus Brocadiaceae bacterium]
MIKERKYIVSAHILTFGIVLFLTMGCHVIPKQVREHANPSITFQELMKDPEKFKGQTVILSGVIIETTNTKEGTLIKVLQRPAGFRGQPKDTDETGGRFLALADQYLDPKVYAKDREVTIAGEVQGKRVLQTGEIEYTYPLIHIKEIYIWPVYKEYNNPYPYYYPGFYHPVFIRTCPHQHKCK